jgi:hypothetical protein
MKLGWTHNDQGMARDRAALRKGRAGLHSQSGSILILVLWVCLGLVSLTLMFGHSMWMALRGADNDWAGRQADHAIEGAARYAAFLLNNLEVRGQLPLEQTYHSEQVPVGEAWFWFLSRPEEEIRAIRPLYGLIDEASKLNLNTATQRDARNAAGHDLELAGAIIDWRSEDDENPDAARAPSTYLLRDPPHICKNGPFESVEELGVGARRHMGDPVWRRPEPQRGVGPARTQRRTIRTGPGGVSDRAQS